MNFRGRLAILLILAVTSFSFINSEKNIASYKLIFFEGSDWCMNCIRFEKTVLSEATFEDFVESQAIEIERIDFPQRKQLDETTKQYNISVAEKYNFQGIFPTILLVNTSTDDVIEIRYRSQGPEEFVALVKSKIDELK